MPDLNLRLTTQSFFRHSFFQLKKPLQSLLVRPKPNRIYDEEVALLMQSYQVQQSSLDNLAVWWSQQLWWYEKSLLTIGILSATLIISSLTFSLLAGTLFLGLVKLLTRHYENDSARKERICTDIIRTQKKLTDSLALIKKHEAIFKETLANLEQQNDLLIKDNIIIHQQAQNLEIENQRLHHLVTITEQSVVVFREQQQNFANSTQILTTEMQNFLAKGGQETSKLNQLLRTLIQVFSKNVTTLISIKDKLLSTTELWQQPKSPESATEIDCEALLKESQNLCAKVQQIREENQAHITDGLQDEIEKLSLLKNSF